MLDVNDMVNEKKCWKIVIKEAKKYGIMRREWV